MFDIPEAWWELPIRASLVYASLLVLVRLSGKRTVGQFTPFDLLVVMLLSEGVSSALQGPDTPLLNGLLLAATLVALNVMVGWLTARSARLHSLVEGDPVLVGRDGRVFDEVLRRQRVPRSDLDQALREADCPLEQMQCLFLESDGRISVLRTCLRSLWGRAGTFSGFATRRQNQAQADAVAGFVTTQSARKGTCPSGWGEIGRFARRIPCMGREPMLRSTTANSSRLHPNAASKRIVNTF